MYLKMGQQLSQKFHLSPQMLQSIKLLSLSVTELEQAVRKELEENPVLEEKGETETLEELSSIEKEEREEHLNWTQFTTSKALPDKGEWSHTSDGGIYERSVPENETLRDHLVWQVYFSNYNDEERKILSFIVNEIDDDGYLREPIEKIARANKVLKSKVSLLLKKLHEMDPPGVGARNLKECLLIQARRAGEDTKDMVDLIQNHLQHLRTKNYRAIALRMNKDVEEVRHLAEIITSMEPRPGRLFSSQQTEYVVPDIYIHKKENGSYEAVLNEDGMPQIKIAGHYNQFLLNMGAKEGKKEDSTREYLVEKMKRALAFIRALNQRRENILKIARVIAEEQTAFFEKGEKFLHPYLQREMSEKSGVSISTISRAASNKFIHTPRGVFELKYFFGVSYVNKEGRRLSVVLIKSIMKKVMESEDTALSDNELAKRLFEQEGLNLSRRQVARFREEMGAPSAKERAKERLT